LWDDLLALSSRTRACTCAWLLARFRRPARRWPRSAGSQQRRERYLSDNCYSYVRTSVLTRHARQDWWEDWMRRRPNNDRNILVQAISMRPVPYARAWWPSNRTYRAARTHGTRKRRRAVASQTTYNSFLDGVRSSVLLRLAGDRWWKKPCNRACLSGRAHVHADGAACDMTWCRAQARQVFAAGWSIWWRRSRQSRTYRRMPRPSSGKRNFIASAHAGRCEARVNGWCRHGVALLDGEGAPVLSYLRQRQPPGRAHAYVRQDPRYTTCRCNIFHITV